MKTSYHVHLKNRFPGCEVDETENCIKAFAADGSILCVVEKDGNGVWGANPELSQKLHGAKFIWNLEPLAYEARAYTVERKTNLPGIHEEFAQRKLAGAALAKKFGCVPSVLDMTKQKVNVEAVIAEYQAAEDEEKAAALSKEQSASKVVELQSKVNELESGISSIVESRMAALKTELSDYLNESLVEAQANLQAAVAGEISA